MEEKKYILEEVSEELDNSIYEQAKILEKNLENNKTLNYV